VADGICKLHLHQNEFEKHNACKGVGRGLTTGRRFTTDAGNAAGIKVVSTRNINKRKVCELPVFGLLISWQTA
jgi:phosphoglycerate dehydrogenase-like enzyme